jgi:PncC family amidohydrolase
MNGIDQVCRRIARLLESRHQRIVLAESCTGGLVSASLARVPGISNWLCGSAVTYREETKAAWLKVSRSVLADEGAVSSETARQMARRVLAITAEATLAVSVTGHLGPNAPPKLDGVVYVGTAIRRGKRIVVSTRRRKLKSATRVARQREAARLVLLELARCARTQTPSPATRR